MAGLTKLSSPRFLSFLVVQFLGAANDNAFKNTLALLVIASIADESLQVRYNSLATVLFPLPFLLFSPLAGYLADRYSKGRLVVFTKIPEVAAMALAIFALSIGSLPLLLTVLFLMATQSAFFSPVKYGLLPEAVAPTRLSMANGLLEMTTNLAVLIGSVFGLLMFRAFEGALYKAGWVYLSLAIVGSVFALFVPRTGPGSPAATRNLNLFSAVAANARLARRHPPLPETLAGIAYFAFLGALMLSILPVFGKNALGLSITSSGMLLIPLSVGIGIGSLVAGRLSSGRVEIGLVPLGSLILSIFAADFAFFADAEGWLVAGMPVRVAIDLMMVGVGAGMYIIPLNATLQQRAPEGQKGQLIAFSNVLSFSGVIFAGLLGWLLVEILGLSTRQVMFVIAALTLAVTAYIVIRLPQFLVRLVLWLLAHTFYRIDVIGADNIPTRGGLLVANHVSWVDGILVGAASDRNVRFLMFRPFYESKLMHWFFKRMHTIPISGADTPEQKEASLQMARNEIANGHLVCIFAEGAITRTGNMLKFRRGFEQIADGMQGPIVPVFLDGVWGSIFSYEKGRFLFKWPKRIPYPVRVFFGDPLPATAKTYDVRTAVQELSVIARREARKELRPLTESALLTAKRLWWHEFATDDRGGRVRFGQAFVRALALRTPLGLHAEKRRLGILLPPGLPALLSSWAVIAAGKDLVHLDRDAPAVRIVAEMRRARLDSVLTTREEWKASGLADLAEPAPVTFVDEELARLSALRLWIYAFVCRGLPLRIVRRLLLVPTDVEQTAALIFSESPHVDPDTPSAAQLTHYNIQSNFVALESLFRLNQDDKILAAIPLTTSFGMFGCILFPALNGTRVLFASPDLAQVADRQLADVTVLPVPSQQLAAYEDSGSLARMPALEHLFVAGEPLAPALFERVLSEHRVEPMEGFGAAECAPLIALNLPIDYEHERFAQDGTRAGSVGQPLPGIAIRIVDPVSGRTQPPGHVGRLWVSGENVFVGYLGEPERTDAVLRDGWYDTGYLAEEDPDGFLHLVGPA